MSDDGQRQLRGCNRAMAGHSQEQVDMSMRLSLQVVASDNPEHPLLWRQLAKLPINRGLTDPTVALNTESDHECWMYMYTTNERHRFLWFTWTRYVHVFRHRNHPVTGCEVRKAIPARRGFDERSLVTTWEGF